LIKQKAKPIKKEIYKGEAETIGKDANNQDQSVDKKAKKKPTKEKKSSIKPSKSKPTAKKTKKVSKK